MKTLYNINFDGKGKILKSSYVPAKNNDKQNLWHLEIDNGPTTFMLTVPAERSREATMQNQKKFAVGNVICFKATLVRNEVVALALHRVDSHQQGRLNL